MRARSLGAAGRARRARRAARRPARDARRVRAGPLRPTIGSRRCSTCASRCRAEARAALLAAGHADRGRDRSPAATATASSVREELRASLAADYASLNDSPLSSLLRRVRRSRASRSSPSRAAVRLQGPRGVATSRRKHISGDEVGVQMDCKEAGPRIKRWRTDKLGNRQDDTHSITPRRVRATCGTRSTAPAGRTSTIARTAAARRAIRSTCSTSRTTRTRRRSRARPATMPYPYNDITDPLDLARAAGPQAARRRRAGRREGARQEGQATVTVPPSDDRGRHRCEPRHRARDRDAARRRRRGGRAVGARSRRRSQRVAAEIAAAAAAQAFVVDVTDSSSGRPRARRGPRDDAAGAHVVNNAGAVLRSATANDHRRRVARTSWRSTSTARST